MSGDRACFLKEWAASSEELKSREGGADDCLLDHSIQVGTVLHP